MLGLAAIAILAASAVHTIMAWALNPRPPDDWLVFSQAADRIVHGLDPYAFITPAGASYRYSPALAWVFAILQPIGPIAWALLWVAALGRANRRALVFAAVTPFFWDEIFSGINVLFLPVIGLLALRGSRAASLAWIALSVLIPRPLMLPMLAWLLWRRPRLRLPAIAIVAGCLAASLLTGWMGQWLTELLSIVGAGDQTAAIFEPARALGLAWIPLAGAVAIWLTRRGRVGLASLVASPYILPAYPLILLLDLGTSQASPDDKAPSVGSAQMDGQVLPG